jgi:hypothetical protein
MRKIKKKDLYFIFYLFLDLIENINDKKIRKNNNIKYINEFLLLLNSSNKEKEIDKILKYEKNNYKWSE